MGHRQTDRAYFAEEDVRGLGHDLSGNALAHFVFFLVFAAGFVSSRFKVIREDSLPALAQVITKVLLPCMIFYSTYANCERQTIIDNWEMVLLAAFFYALISLVTFLLAKALRIEHDKDRVFQLCFIFGNTGFVGIPLLAAVFPDAGLVYMMMFSIIDQLVFWTYGIWLSTARCHDHGRNAGPEELHDLIRLLQLAGFPSPMTCFVSSESTMAPHVAFLFVEPQRRLPTVL